MVHCFIQTDLLYPGLTKIKGEKKPRVIEPSLAVPVAWGQDTVLVTPEIILGLMPGGTQDEWEGMGAYHNALDIMAFTDC